MLRQSSFSLYFSELLKSKSGYTEGLGSWLTESQGQNSKCHAKKNVLNDNDVKLSTLARCWCSMFTLEEQE